MLEDYVVERELGRGGFGIVWLMRSRTTGEPFAVKQIRTDIGDEAAQRAILQDLQAWIDLPVHPHLVTYRFFRTLGRQTLLFADFVSGGSLLSWIQQRKLPNVDSILDVAIQFAWGLHAAHESGVVHQDVKPANVLMTNDGVAKVSDFGLARASRTRAEASALGASLQLTGGALTRAYCSPEQAAGRRLDRRTDVWSFGLSVLEMFVGEVTWGSGIAALEVLQEYREGGPAVTGIAQMPPGVGDVLERCFAQDPRDRWSTMEAVAEQLLCVSQMVVDRAYTRTAPSTNANPASIAPAHERRSSGATWDDPRIWLDRALAALGRDPREADALVSPRGKSRRAQAVGDLAAYEQARLLMAAAVERGHDPRHLATLLDNKALVHSHLDDSPGALAVCDEVIALHERVVEREGRRGLTGLALTHLTRAAFLDDARAVVAACDKSLAILESFAEEIPGARAVLAGSLAQAYQFKASALSTLGDASSALDLYDRAIAIREQLVRDEGPSNLDALADAYMGKANAVVRHGNAPASVTLYDQAIAIKEQLVHAEGRRELANDLATMYLNKSSAVEGLAAIGLCDQAIAIREELVHRNGRGELADDLATAYVSKATKLWELDDAPASAALLDRAIAIQEQLVRKEGRHDIAPRLASTYVNKAGVVGKLDGARAAVALYDRGIAIRERLVNEEGRDDLKGDLAWARVYRAKELASLGDTGAREEARDTLAELRAEIARTGRTDLKSVVAGADIMFTALFGADGLTPPRLQHQAFVNVIVRDAFLRHGRVLLYELFERPEKTIVSLWELAGGAGGRMASDGLALSWYRTANWHVGIIKMPRPMIDEAYFVGMALRLTDQRKRYFVVQRSSDPNDARLREWVDDDYLERANILGGPTTVAFFQAIARQLGA